MYPTNRSAPFMEYLIPGIRKYANQHDCSFEWDGHVPAIGHNSKLIQLDIHRMANMSKNDKYCKLMIYVRGACERALA